MSSATLENPLKRLADYGQSIWLDYIRRTLLTSGILEAALTSRTRLNQRLETPQLAVKYQPPAESQYART